MRNFIIAVIVLTSTYLSAAPEMWREGPLTIEAQAPDSRVMDIWHEGPLIAVVDAHGRIFRGNVPIEQLDRDQLELLVRELISFEVMKSSPPKRRR